MSAGALAGMRSIGRMLSEVERSGRPSVDLQAPARIPRILGITGPAGAGKSTLVMALIDKIRKSDQSVAAVLVDPSSPKHGGALLGDRVRLAGREADGGVFVRSMATRGAFGGISAALPAAVVVLASAGFDWVIIETVGIGQTDVAVAEIVDTTVLMFTPESGDEIQTEKAGVLEIADVLVVNKGDREGTDRMVENLRRRADRAGQNEKRVPVMTTVAHNGQGIDELWDLLLERPPRSEL